ncbi:GPP34 family phosphoprotein [Mycobacterium sp. CVI_P3]|uniref:GPP34 family phosphoprotein n=1 Tax=Mycobacterium pinniadriaticum TaxID=2994102 RepID=A0ABT3SNS8_9MYCO|nr:GPP34 family phosphoprotein [Mycobacterium pinniadriaticum]MCX2934762.1 GPP34 family phosphoprotein [Mycobacterium pinniadriaticum]MCX2941193.1 GPP34 family phosphoprotein [Mycobacterium pinniadriaticum]
MARIAEDLLLLLLDNAAAQPALEPARLQRVLAAAVILDLAYDCRVRPALPEEPIPADRLVVLTGPPQPDPVVRPALALLHEGPITASAAIDKLRKHVEDHVLDQLLRTGQLHQVSLSEHRFRRNSYAWPLASRARADRARSALLAALFDGHRPDPATAAIVSLLYTVRGLDAVLSLNDRGWQWVVNRASEIASGTWVDDEKMADVNLAVTTAAVRAALA